MPLTCAVTIDIRDFGMDPAAGATVTISDPRMRPQTADHAIILFEPQTLTVPTSGVLVVNIRPGPVVVEIFGSAVSLSGKFLIPDQESAFLADWQDERETVPLSASQQAALDARTARDEAEDFSATAQNAAATSTAQAETATAQAAIATGAAANASGQAGIATDAAEEANALLQQVIELEESARLSSAAAGTASGRLEVATFAELATAFGYTGAGGRRTVAGGDRIRVIDTLDVYIVRPLGTAVAHLNYTASGGIMLDALPRNSNHYHVAQIGAVGVGNETAIIQAFAALLPAGSELHFDGSKTYTLAIASAAPIYWAPNGATFRNASTSLPILSIGSQTAAINHPVTETVIPYGSRTFTVAGASTKFQVGQIATLHDSRGRPSDGQAVNFHTIKIAAISGDTITVEGRILAHMQGSIILRHTTGQIKDAGIIGHLHLEPTSPSGTGVLMTDVERPRYDYVTGRNTIGPGLTLRYCYDIRGGNADFRAPGATGSGQGYGVQLLACTGGWIFNTHGVGMRHALDLESTYSVRTGIVSDPAPASTPCGIAHNGFGGHIHIDGYRGGGAAGFYGVAFSAQGHVGGAADPDPLFPLRNFSIGFVDVVMDPASSVQTFTVAAVYLQCYVDGYVYIGPVTVHYTHPDMPTASAASTAVRVNGGIRGVVKVESISGNKIGTAFASYFSGTAANNANWRGTVDLGPIDYDEQARYAVLWRNNGTLILKSAHSPAGVGEAPAQIATSTGGANLENMLIGPIDFGDSVQPVAFSGNTRVYGEIAKTSKNTTVSLQFAATGDSAITADQLYTRGTITRLSVTYTPAGSNHDITTFPAPRVEGETIDLWVVSSTHSVTIKASANVLSDVVIPAGGRVTLRAHNRQWIR